MSEASATPRKREASRSSILSEQKGKSKKRKKEKEKEKENEEEEDQQSDSVDDVGKRRGKAPKSTKKDEGEEDEDYNGEEEQQQQQRQEDEDEDEDGAVIDFQFSKLINVCLTPLCPLHFPPSPPPSSIPLLGLSFSKRKSSKGARGSTAKKERTKKKGKGRSVSQSKSEEDIELEPVSSRTLISREASSPAVSVDEDDPGYSDDDEKDGLDEEDHVPRSKGKRASSSFSSPRKKAHEAGDERAKKRRASMRKSRDADSSDLGDVSTETLSPQETRTPRKLKDQRSKDAQEELAEAQSRSLSKKSSKLGKSRSIDKKPSELATNPSLEDSFYANEAEFARLLPGEDSSNYFETPKGLDSSKATK